MKVALLLLALASEEGGPVFTRCELSRERVANRVIVQAQIQNTLGIPLNDVRLTFAYYDGDREVKRSRALLIGRLEPGKSAPVNLETEHVEKFDRFEVLLTSGDREFSYEGTDPTQPPKLRKAPPPRLELTAQKDAPPKGFPGTAVLTLTVKNTGTVKAREPVATLIFLDRAKNPVRQAHVQLAGAIEVATEDTFEISVPGCPEYAAVQAAVASLASDITTPADPLTIGPRLEVGNCTFVRLTDGSVRLRGVLRNGLANAIRKVKVTFQFAGRTHPLQVAGTVPPGSQRNLELYVPECPPVQDYSYNVDLEEIPGAEDFEVQPVPLARRTASRVIRETELAGTKAPAATVELRGLKWVRTSNQPSKRPIPEVVFLRLAVRNRDGKSLHPFGSIAVTIQEGKKTAVPVLRTIKEEHWGLDAEEATAKGVNPEIVAYDPIGGELWVGLLRLEKPGVALKADVTLNIPGVGTWEWKGLENTFESPAKGPSR